jgi:8-oxo-dGTP diphosphatase
MTKNPQKVLPDRYLVVPRTIIFILNEDLVLLQKGSETKKIFPGFFNGIGGHIERGETPLEGARRELHEETGLSCEDLRLTGTIHIDVNEQQGILLFVFYGSQVTGTITGSSEGELHWIYRSEIQDLKIVEDVPELIHNSMLSIEQGKQFFAKYLYDLEGRKTTLIEWD